MTSYMEVTMERRDFFKAGAGSLAVAGAAVLAADPTNALAPPRPNRIISETRAMEQVGNEVISVHRIEMKTGFEPSSFCDIPDPSRPRGLRRIVFPYWDGELTQEKIEACLKAYRGAGFDRILPGPNMPAPMGFFIRYTWEGKRYHAGGVTGYDLTSENLVMMVPARAIFG